MGDTHTIKTKQPIFGVAIHGVLTYAFEDFSGLDFTVAVMDSALFQKISN